ncbi:MAG: hypothetical protein JSS02_18245 [Planctomycetes bacterium]|nr:hypothetical protein [Planctomycetota bacterium]
MYFCDLGFAVTAGANTPEGHTREEVNNSTAAAVRSIFLSFLPQKYVLDGTRKTNVNLGPANGQHQYWQACGVSTYYVEDFNFHTYFELSPERRYDMLLDVLEASLLDIASRFGADPTPIRQTIAATRECGGERRYTIPRLAKSTPSRKLKLNVFRHIGPEYEKWGIDVTDRKGDVLKTEWIVHRTNFTDASYKFRKAVVEAGEFVLLGSLGEVTYRLKMHDLEQELINTTDRP